MKNSFALLERIKPYEFNRPSLYFPWDSYWAPATLIGAGYDIKTIAFHDSPYTAGNGHVSVVYYSIEETYLEPEPF